MSVEITLPPSRNRLCCTKILKQFGRHRNRVQPSRGSAPPDSEFFEAGPHRIIHVIRPELKSGHYYEAPAAERPESIIDNFYTRWARRPHPSGDCRCSFRQSLATGTASRLSRPEDALVSRIRTSLCEAERTGRDIDELERSLANVDLTQLATVPCHHLETEPVRTNEESPLSSVRSRVHLLDEETKQRIVKDLDRYISDLLDEILNDTIRAIAKSENPFGKKEVKEEPPPERSLPPTFDITFAFHSSENGKDEDKNQEDAEDKADEDTGIRGYVNQGFVGSASDPDTMDFHLCRGLLGGDRILENPDCTDSGINSVETVELQTEQEQNLEQSLMDIIDAKLGGSSIGKSLENLGMEIDATDDTNQSVEEESIISEVSNSVNEEANDTTKDKSVDVNKSMTKDKEVTASTEKKSKDSVSEKALKSRDDAIEEPGFNSLRLEFKQSNNSTKDVIEEKPQTRTANRFSKTLSLIRRRLIPRLDKRRRKRTNRREATTKPNSLSLGGSKSTYMRSSLRPIDLHRRRFPVPPTRPRSISPELEDDTDTVTLRRRGRKPTIIFLHGFGSSADSFQPQLRYFSELGYPCIAPDLLGHGLSSAPRRKADYRFDRLLDDLEAVLLSYAFRPGQKCVIVGHNYGCSFATALAQKYAANVHQLVLIAGGGPIPLAPPPAREGTGHCCLRSCLTPLLFCGVRRGVMYSARGRQHPYCGPEGIPWTSTHLRHVLRGMTWPEGDHVFLRRICTPTLLVHGLRDNKVSLVQECQMERTMGKAVLEAIPSAGHMPMTDCPEQLNHMIHCFIDLWKNKKW